MNPIDNAIVLEEAKRYTDKQRIAYVEETVLSWNANTAEAEKMQLGDEMLLKLSDDVVDLTKTKKIFLQIGSLYEEMDDVVVENDQGITMIFYGTDVILLVVPSGAEISAGVWLNLKSFGNGNYDCRVSVTTETIHPIDHKFLPGAVVNLCDYGINVYELTQKGTSGYFVMDTELAQKLHKKIPADGSRVVLVTDDGVNPIVHDQSAVIMCRRDYGVSGISSFIAVANPAMQAVLYIDVHVAFTFNTESGAVDATRVYYNCSTKSLPTTEVS